MSVHLSLPCVVVDADAVAHLFPGGRTGLRAALRSHPAVLKASHDKQLEVAYLGADREFDASELVAELQCRMPNGSGLRDHCVAVSAAKPVPVRPWLRVEQEPSSPVSVAWHATAGRGRLAPLRAVREAAGLEIVPTRAIHLARQAFARFGWTNRSIDLHEEYAVVNGTYLLTPLSVMESDDGLALHVTVWLPCGPSADTADALTAAIARTNARIRWCQIENAHGERHIRLKHWFVADPRQVSAEHVRQVLHHLLYFANTVGVAIARTALGQVPGDSVDVAIDALLARAA